MTPTSAAAVAALDKVLAERDALRAQLAQVEGENAQLREACDAFESNSKEASEVFEVLHRAGRVPHVKPGPSLAELVGGVIDQCDRLREALLVVRALLTPILEQVGIEQLTQVERLLLAAIDAALEATPPAETTRAADVSTNSPTGDMVQVPVCATCNDTHRMVMETRGMVSCTHCPTPCERCRGRRSAFCDKTPCACECHRALLESGR